MNMKKILALVLALVMCFSLVACGGEEEAPETEAAAPAEEEMEGADDPISEESWNTVQECYAAVVEMHDAFIELYHGENVAASEDINDRIVEIEEIMTDMGELEAEGMTEGDAVSLIEIMTAIVDELNAMIDDLTPAE